MKILILFLLVTVAVVAISLIEPIAQNTGYHQFADQRVLYGIPNFWNVVSNVLFFIFGLFGLIQSCTEPASTAMRQKRRAYGLFFTAALLLGAGSTYYHLNPTNNALLWDRLPMALLFMSFFSIIIAEYISVSAGRLLLYPLIATGVIAVIYWYRTETQGAGDLRMYALVQFLPIVLTPYIIIAFKHNLGHGRKIWLILILFVLAKTSEQLDQLIFGLTTYISGHTVKHVLAALAILVFYWHFKRQNIER